MPTRTGAYLAEQRRTQHLSPQRLAAALGYTNLAKGARRILALERDAQSKRHQGQVFAALHGPTERLTLAPPPLQGARGARSTEGPERALAGHRTCRTR